MPSRRAGNHRASLSRCRGLCGGGEPGGTPGGGERKKSARRFAAHAAFVEHSRPGAGVWWPSWAGNAIYHSARPPRAPLLCVGTDTSGAGLLPPHPHGRHFVISQTPTGRCLIRRERGARNPNPFVARSRAEDCCPSGGFDGLRTLDQYRRHDVTEFGATVAPLDKALEGARNE